MKLSAVPLFLGLCSLGFALVVPATPQETCSPRFSGLVQQITATSNGRTRVRFDSSSAMDGLLAVSARGVQHSKAEEWFVAQDGPGMYSLSSGAASRSCQLSAQHLFASSECVTPHEYFISCESCDRHEDSASACQIESVSRRQCLTLNRKGTALVWDDCRTDGAKLALQQFDIRP